MKIDVRPCGKYKNITVEVNSGVFDLGLSDEEEYMNLARELNTAVFDLLGKDKYKDLVNETIN